jgi:hypothetical protein
MARFTGLFGLAMVGMALMWSSAAIAQTSASGTEARRALKGRPVTSGTSASQASTQICDSSGNICVQGSTSGPAGPPPLASAASAKTEPVPEGAAGANHTGTIAQPVLLRPAVSQDNGSKRPAHISTESPAAIPSVPGPSVEELEFLDHQGGTAVYDGMANPMEWTVHVYKSRHLLDVYFNGHLYRSYHAVFGRSPFSGGKEWEGDMRTPEGNYLIVSKHRSGRFGWFLRLNYPNAFDEERFEQSRAAHLIPARAREGGQIGIHGTDAPALNVGDVNWTTGCISVGNAEINEMAQLLPVGTLVVIAP